MFVVSVDIAKRIYEVLVIDGSDELIQKPFSFKNTTQGFKQFLVKFYKISHNKEDFIIAMEVTNHYWIAILSAVSRQKKRIRSCSASWTVVAAINQTVEKATEQIANTYISLV